MTAVTNRYAEAVEKFREGRYFDAHEGFEELWRAALGADREWYQGWVLVSAALFHRDRGNARGAASCLERAARHWSSLPPGARVAETDRVLAAVRRVLGQEWAHPDLGSGEDRRQGAEGEREGEAW